MDDIPLDVSEPTQVRSRKKNAKLRREQELEELRNLLSLPGSRWFFWRLLSECGVFQTGSSLDPHSMAVKSGRRDMGLWTLAELVEADENAYTLLLKEAREREKPNG